MQNEMDGYSLKLAVWEKKYKQDFKDLTDFDMQSKGIMDKWNSDHKKPDAPRGCNYRVGKATVNGLIETLAKQPFAGMFSSEAGEFFNSHAFQGGKDASKSLEMLTTLTNAWDGHEIERTTGVDHTKLYDRRFNMLFMLQAAMAKDWLGNSLYSDQGFVHRLLITHCEDWDMPELDRSRLEEIETATKNLDPFHNRIYKLLSAPFETQEDKPLQLKPVVYRVDPPAIDALADFNNSVQRLRKDKYKAFDGFAARVYEHALRLAATLAAFEEKDFIDLAAAEAGIELMEFYLEQRLSLELGASSKNANQVKVANKVEEWLEKNGEVTAHNRLTKFGPGCYRGLSVDEREGVMREVLSRGNYAIEEKDTGGIRLQACYVRQVA
jgi:hypothetical protein